MSLKNAPLSLKVREIPRTIQRMAKARTQHNDAPPITQASFRAQLELALTHFGDPDWLGVNSPLAAPYIFGALQAPRGTLRSPGERAAAQGMALRARLLAAAQTLRPSPEQRFDPARLLELTYFKPSSVRTQAGIATELEISPATYYRHRAEAITQLEAALVADMRVASHTDRPSPVGSFVGRALERDTCLRALQSKKIVALTGESGSGKTTLGAQIVAALEGPVFWHTFRSGINDRLPAVIFALAQFLQSLGEPGLWMQLAANQNKIEADLALALTRAAFDRLGGRPVLVFDEADLIAPRALERVDEAHQATRNFIEALAVPPRPGPAMLLIGQQLLVEPHVHFILEGLSRDDTRRMLADSGTTLALPADEERFYSFTHGNPLLITLFLALHKSGEALTDTLRGLAQAPSMQLLLNRISRRLSVAERLTLALLAVFEGAAPADAWRDELGAALQTMLDRGLVISDGRGGVSLQPALREAIGRQVSIEQRARSHLFAAQARAERAEYTQAAAHYVEAGEPVLAVLLWSEHREREIARGNASAALAVFERINRDLLDDPEQRALILIRSHLRELAGDGQAALRDLDALVWSDDDVGTPQAKMLAGNFEMLLGNTDRALAHFRNGLRATDRQLAQLPLQRTHLFARSGYAHITARDLDNAWAAALNARFEASYLQGEVESERGNYSQAQQHFESALDHAATLNSPAAAARAHFALGTLAGRREDAAGAVTQLDHARAIFAALGDLVQVHRCEANIGFCHVQSGNYQAALAPAQRSLDFFLALNRPYFVALNAGNLAEAHLRLDDLDRAEHYALQAMQQEDPGAMAYGMTVIAEVRLRQRRLQDADHAAADAVRLAIASNDAWAEAAAQRVLGQICVELNETDRARSAYARAIDDFFGARPASRSIAHARVALILSSKITTHSPVKRGVGCDF